MPYVLWSQDNFSKGELSPFMYARAQVQQYYEGVKIGQNAIMYPTGAIGKRFGTLFQAILNSALTPKNFYFQTFQYLDQCVYQLVWRPFAVDIYLEGILVQTVVTAIDGNSVYNLSSTVIGAAFRITVADFTPKDLIRLADNGPIYGPNVINGFTSTTLTLTTPEPNYLGLVLPVVFTTTNTLPSPGSPSSPAILAGITYFVNFITASSISVYATANDAKFNNNPFTFSNAGTGTNTVITQNNFDLIPSYFKNLPFYDFNNATTPYTGITFSASATSGGAVTITLSAPYIPLIAATYVGGAFFMSGGSSRITAVASNTSFTVAVQTPFDTSGTPIPGTLVFLAEPAWSTARGFPTKCSSYQNRAIFANTASLPNGFWTSVINDYTDFGDLTSDADDAISWFPSSNDVNSIRFIVPYRSLTVHTNTGIYSSALSEIGAITPTSFSLQLQDSTPADVLQPQAIDNQIFVVSGNDCHTMIWDGINNAYTTNIVSIASEQVIRTPVDESAFADLTKAGSRYIFIINNSGSLAIFQSLLSEQVSGWTQNITEQSYGASAFSQSASSFDGRCWFVTFRTNVVINTTINVTGFTAATSTVPSSLQVIAHNQGTVFPFPLTFTTTGSLPATVPVLTTQQYYWGLGSDANDIFVFNTYQDALNGINQLSFTSSGVNTQAVIWKQNQIFCLEELSQITKVDCAVQVTNNSPTATVTTGSLFNAQEVAMVGDGFGYTAVGFNNQVVFEAHGSQVPVSNALIGFPINTIIEPLPLSPPPGQQTTLTKPKHIRSVRFMFNNTIGGFIKTATSPNGIPIALEPFNMAAIGEPPTPASGIFEVSVFSGWDDFKQPSFTINHSDPFDIQLLGIFYSIEI